MELKDYQVATLDAFVRWKDELDKAHADYLNVFSLARAESINFPDHFRNFPKTAWETVANSGGVAESSCQYVDRYDAAGRPIPHVCFKVPTGGGKTLLAAAALERLNRQAGFTLWITPTSAIYEQTKIALWNREHPYRQMLERASSGRVLMLEKEDIFTMSDVENYLCVMLLMLPAANRQRSRNFLRMFRDSGRYPTLFPGDDDELGEQCLLKDHRDLERSSEDGPAKRSLFNVFKILRPVVVLDEAHKAYGSNYKKTNDKFVQSVNRLNPRLVIELSATPNKSISNLLVDISGVELKKEEMIKLPVQVTSITNVDWQYTLAQAHEKLKKLSKEAEDYQHREGRYIRPIAVVRVERTGSDQRNSEYIHSEDVRDYLTLQLGVPKENVRVKSSDKDELGRENLLSEYSTVRWIITKAALMEGWDCPFAYLLVMLDNTSADNAITQLVGRVLRQPHALRTGRELLDQCYVYCWKIDVEKAVTNVKSGLEQEGLTGLGSEVLGETEKLKRVTVRRREEFLNNDIYLPLVLHKDGNGWTELDYQHHILPEIDWTTLVAPEPISLRAYAARRISINVDLNSEHISRPTSKLLRIDKTVKLSWFTRRLADVIPNPWQAARIVQDLLYRLQACGETKDSIYDKRDSISLWLRENISREVEMMSEEVFRKKLQHGQIRFDLETKSLNFKIRNSYQIPISENSELLAGNDGWPIRLNLFEPMHAQHFDTTLERNFARYLDEQQALTWWHRVAARQSRDYYLRGWKQRRIWPDFVAMARESKGITHLLVFETKGEHLRENEDTKYKERVMEALQNAFNCGTMTIHDGLAKGTFRLVFKDGFAEALDELNCTANSS